MDKSDEFIKDFFDNSDDALLLLREAVKQIAFYRRLLERFEVDTLTGLPGSGKYFELIQNVKDYATSIGVMFFDVNGLKHYNDTVGHQAGNLLLQKAAESINHIADKNIKAFRIGGDEFVAVVINCAENDLADIMEKWHKKLSELNSADDGMFCSVAVGMAYASGQYIIDDVIKLADERMYDNKRKMKELAASENK